MRVGFESTSYILSETVGKVEVCVSLPGSQPLQFDFTLTIATVDGSASEWWTQSVFAYRIIVSVGHNQCFYSILVSG